MNSWLRRIGGMVLMGLAWAAAWAPVGLLIRDLAASADKLWVPVAQPGLLCGAVFAAALRIADGRRTLDELSLARAGAFGFVIGLFVGALPFGISTPTTDLPIWLLGAEIIGPVTLLSSVSAVGSVLIARMAARRHVRGGSAGAV